LKPAAIITIAVTAVEKVAAVGGASAAMRVRLAKMTISMKTNIVSLL
jgi:hypothetical protein